MRSELRFFSTVIFICLYLSVANAQTELYFGNCTGQVVQNISNMSINRLYARDYETWFDGWCTRLEIDRFPVKPSIHGQAGPDINNFLVYLANQGYSTVNLVGYHTGGWYIGGGRNLLAEKAYAEKERMLQQARQARERRESPKSAEQKQKWSEPCKPKITSAELVEMKSAGISGAYYYDIIIRGHCMSGTIYLNGENTGELKVLSFTPTEISVRIYWGYTTRFMFQLKDELNTNSNVYTFNF